MGYRITDIFWGTITCLLPLSGIGQVFDEDQSEYPQYIQEFFYTEAAYIQEKNELQFTLSNYYQRQNQIGLLMEYGLTERLQIEAEFSDITNKNSGGFSGQVGFLYAILNSRNTALSIATEGGVEEELDEELKRETNVEWESKVIFSKPLGFAQVHTEVGVELSENTEWTWNTGLIAPVRDFKGILEFNGLITDLTRWQITPGVVWNGWEGSELALGVPLKLYGTDNKTGVVIRLTLEFDVK